MKTRCHHAALLGAALLGPLCASNAMAEQPATGKVQAVKIDFNRFYIAVDYDAKADKKAVAIIQAFFDLKIPFLPLPKDIANTRYDPSLDVVYWNASAAVQVANDSGAGTGKYISPAIQLLDAMADAVAHARSAPGYANLAASPDPLFGTLEQRRVIAGLTQSDALAKLHDQTPSAVADADKILAAQDGNGLENAIAAEMGEPARTNATRVLQNGNAVEGVTYMTVDDPTWHRN